MTSVRLGAAAAATAVERLAALGAGPALAGRLRALRDFLIGLPGEQVDLPLLAAAEAVGSGAAEPVEAFKEFRRTANNLARAHGIDVRLNADGKKRASPDERVWWVSAPDPATEGLREMSAAMTAGTSDAPLLPARGRRERDGKPVVGTYLDAAPGDRAAMSAAVELLSTRLDTDKDYVFDWLRGPPVGASEDAARRDALAAADLVIVMLSPKYLVWSRDPAQTALPVAGAGRAVVPVVWSTLTPSNSLGPFTGCVLFGRHRRTAVGGHPGGETVVGLHGSHGPALDDRMADLHHELASVLATVADGSRVTPLTQLANDLAVADEPDPVTARARRAVLDKGRDALASHGPGVDVLDHLLGWATATEARPYLVVFGEYGMGKTVATQSLTRELLRRRETDPSVPLPIYFDLRRLGSELRRRDATLDELLSDLIGRAWRTGRIGPSATADDVVTHVQQHRAVVIFDGLDEVLVHMSEHQGQNLLRELLRVLPLDAVAGRSGPRPGAGRVVLTCRTHFFRTIRDQHTYFRGEDRDVGAALYEGLHLLPFDDDQIRNYLEARHGHDDLDRVLSLLRSVHDLAGLARRPYTLSLISDQIARLEHRVAADGRIDAAALYDELVQSWLERDIGKHQFERTHKLRLMEDLAAHLWRTGVRQIAVGDLEAWLRRQLCADDDLGRWVQLARPDPAVLAEDLRTAAFIVRPGADAFEFAHTSLLEFFLARFLHRTIRDGAAHEWDMPTVSDEALDFLIELAATANDGAVTDQLERCGGTYQSQVSELVVRYAARALSRGAPAPSLANFDLAGADLLGLTVDPAPGRTLDMTGCRLTGACLDDARLRGVHLDDADLAGASLRRAELFDCSMTGVDLRGANLDGAILRHTSLRATRLDGARGDDSQWLWCELDGESIPPVPGALYAPGDTDQRERSRLEILAGSSGPSDGSASVAWSPDGQRLAAGDSVGLTIWNPMSGAQHARHHSLPVASVAWSPDGSRLATIGDAGLEVWDPGRPAADPVRVGGAFRIGAVAWSPDGSRLATTGDAGLEVWDPDRPHAALIRLSGRAEMLAWSPDGSRLATASLGGVEEVWDPARPDAAPVRLTSRGRSIGRVRAGHAAWSPDGTWLATAIIDGTVEVWDPARPGTTPVRLDGAGPVGALTWSPDGSRLATVTLGGGVKVWDPARPDAAPIGLTSDNGMGNLVWSPDGSRIATSVPSGVEVWDPTRPDAAPVRLTSGDFIPAFAWSPDGSRIATASFGGVVEVWDPAHPAATPFQLACERRLQTVAWSPDGARLATGSDGGVVEVWDPVGFDAAPVRLTSVDGLRPRRVAWSPDWTRFATGTLDGAVEVWDPVRPGAAPVRLAGGGGLGDLVWSPDGTRLAIASVESVEVRDLDRPDARPIRLPGAHEVGTLAWSPDGTGLATARRGGAVEVWDLDRPDAPPARLPGARDVGTLAWSPDGTALATANRDGAVEVWNLVGPDTPPIRMASEGRLKPRDLAWSPDGSQLATATSAGVEVWDPNRPDAVPVRLGRGGGVAVAWSPDGSRLATVGVDGVEVWDAAYHQVGAIHLLPGEAWCTLGPDRGLIATGGEAWRWLRWRRTDSGLDAPLVAAEAFGVLPTGVQRP